MSKLKQTITLKGESGNTYQFELYPYSTSFNDISCVYIVARLYKDAANKLVYTLVYIGETSKLGDRFKSHHRENCFKRRASNCIGIYRVVGDKKRLAIETDLIRANNPPCNKQ